MNEYEKRIAEIDEQIEKLAGERFELYRKNVGHYIINIYRGDGNYWDEYLKPVGLMTEEEARKLVDEKNDYCSVDCWMGANPPYMRVDKDTFMKYQDWMYLERAKRALHCVSNSTTEVKVVEMIEEIERRIESIAIDLGIKETSFTHICTD